MSAREGNLDSPCESARPTEIFCGAEQSYGRVLLLDVVGATVGRTVVNDDDLVQPPRLTFKRGEALLQKG